MLQCEIISFLFSDEEQNIHTVFGLRFFYEDARENTIKEEKDLFFDESRAIEIMNLINKADLSEAHIGDILEDALI